jgi:hypothetical protein
VRPLDAHARMADLLRARGVTLDPMIEGGELPGGEARTAWECFTQMAAEPAYEPFVNRWGTRLRADPARDGDLLLFETFVAKGWGDEPATFGAWFRRQFSFEDDDGEYAGMNAVTLYVDWDDLDALTSLARAQLWGKGGEGTAAWAAEVEALDAFRLALATPPRRVGFGQSDI